MISITTDHPVAADSLDHIYPYATAFDNSVLSSFNEKLFKLIPAPRLLDIGCAGGGLVRSIIDDGGFAVGVEGSDYSQRVGRAEWPVIPDNLFTADATKPFYLTEDCVPLTFNVITAWEFFEHIPKRGVRGVLRNVVDHLDDDGLFIVSISTQEMGLSLAEVNEDGSEVPAGIQFHINIHDRKWWLRTLRKHGFGLDATLTEYFDPDWVRGPSTGVGGSICAVFRRQ